MGEGREGRKERWNMLEEREKGRIMEEVVGMERRKG